MAEPLSRELEIRRLIELADASRGFLTTEVHSLRHRLDVPARMRDSLKSNPTGWVLGSAVSGLFASMMFRRKPAAVEPKKSRTLSTALLGLTLTAVRPLAKVWLTGQLKNYVAGHLASHSTKNPTAGPPKSQPSI